MKIKVTQKSLEEVRKLPVATKKDPKNPAPIFRKLLKTLSAKDLKDTNFTYKLIGMDKLPEEGALVLMNHSSFIDLEIASTVLYPHAFNIVCTNDGFIGKEWLMRAIGCIPTYKFVTDTELMPTISKAIHRNGAYVLMYPEASYSFDGTATPLPDRLGVMLKRLKAPVIMIKTYGAFARDPLYNNLQIRKVDVSAEISMLASLEDLKTLSSEELDNRLKEAFSFDNFSWQKENNVEITEDFRADSLERILYKCPNCGKEACLTGKGTEIRCSKCGAVHSLGTDGQLKPVEGELKFPHIPDWYKWEREQVKQELEAGTYKLDCKVTIRVLRDLKSIYEIGKGRLIHDLNGFRLEDEAGNEIYSQSPGACYGLYADYYWYELGDMICIGDHEMLYYCFPEDNVPVAKARLAAEELYKIVKGKKRRELHI